MKYIIKFLTAIYELLIALPLFVCTTTFCAVFTIVFIHWSDSCWVHAVQVWWSRSFCRLFLCKVTVDGKENIDPHQSCVFVSNHQSLADVFVIYGWLPVIFKWIMKKELRRIPLVGLACEAAGHIFLDRKSRASAVKSIQKAEKTLQNGVSVVIFPEGTRSGTGEVGKFKRGAFQIAFDLGLPIVPLSLSGCMEVQKKGDTLVNLFRHVHLHIDKPIETKEQEQDQIIELARNRVIEGMITIHN